MALSLMAFLALFARCRLGQGFPRARSLGTLGILGGLAMAPPSLCFPSQALDAKDSWDGEIVRIEHAIRPGSSSAHKKASPAGEPWSQLPGLGTWRQQLQRIRSSRADAAQQAKPNPHVVIAHFGAVWGVSRARSQRHLPFQHDTRWEPHSNCACHHY